MHLPTLQMKAKGTAFMSHDYNVDFYEYAD